jgi:hypothetical protein
MPRANTHNRYVDALRSLQDVAFTFGARNSLELSSRSLENTHSIFMTARLPSLELCTMDQKPFMSAVPVYTSARATNHFPWFMPHGYFFFRGMEERYCHDKDMNAGRA